MDARAIEQKLRLGEDSRTEFKGLEAKSLARAVAAFANWTGPRC
jgi:hypothetical protein